MKNEEKLNHEKWMKIALLEAKKAMDEDEIPIGAILVKDENLIYSAHNLTKKLNNKLAHAEKIVIEKAILKGENFLYDYTLYTTLEPCIMCSGIIVLSKISKVVFACFDPKSGACGSLYNLPEDKRLNHRAKIISGILAEESSILLKKFFKSKREIK